jgi:hypothetical protein
MNSGKRPMDVQVTTLSKLLEERTKIANERSKTLGTFNVRMVVTVPIINDRSRTKNVTVASWQNATVDQSKYLKEKFLKSNDEYDPSHFEFSFIPYPIAI